MNEKLIYCVNTSFLASKNFKIIQKIGNGGFSQVWLVQNMLNLKYYAIKIMKVERQLRKTIEAEINILKSLSHPNIVKFYQTFWDRNTAYIVMEYVKAGSLKNCLPLTEKQKYVLFKHLIFGIQYLHQNNIVHCDLKLENILVDNLNDLSSVKIIDFGLSYQLKQNDHGQINYIQTNKWLCGTPYYMAPELFTNAIYTKQIDIWSCGIILFMINYDGVHPFLEKGDTLVELKKKIQNPKFKYLCENCEENDKYYLCDLIKKMTKSDPDQRYTIDQVLAHPWITRQNKQIPLTAFEIRKAFETQQTITKIIGFLLVVEKLKQNSNKQQISSTSTLSTMPTPIQTKRPSLKIKYSNLFEEILMSIKNTQILKSQRNGNMNNQNQIQNNQTCSQTLEKKNPANENIKSRFPSKKNIYIQHIRNINNNLPKTEQNINSEFAPDMIQTLLYRTKSFDISCQQNSSIAKLPKIQPQAQESNAKLINNNKNLLSISKNKYYCKSNKTIHTHQIIIQKTRNNKDILMKQLEQEGMFNQNQRNNEVIKLNTIFRLENQRCYLKLNSYIKTLSK